MDEQARCGMLHQLLRQVLAKRGRLTFAAFMRLALYAPGLGYYASGLARAGARGDYVTSPEVHPAFAALIARQVVQCWDLLGQPAPLTVIELGGGRGRFAADFRAALEARWPELAARLRYVLVDPSPGPAVPGVERRRRLPARIDVGCVLANEVFDALPVHLVQRAGGRLREVYVVERGGRLAEELGPLSRPAVRAALTASGVVLAEGQRVEVCLAAPALIARLARMLRCGYVLAFDYGALDWPALVASRPSGTLRTFSGHAPSGDPLERPGAVDITHHIDFAALVRAAEAARMAVIGVATQRTFLMRLGWRAYMAALPTVAHGEAYEANAYALRYLVREDGLGSFLVLGLAAGGAPPTLSGFGGGTEAEADLLPFARAGGLPVPLLTPDHAPLLAARRPAAPDVGELWADLASWGRSG